MRPAINRLMDKAESIIKDAKEKGFIFPVSVPLPMLMGESVLEVTEAIETGMKARGYEFKRSGARLLGGTIITLWFDVIEVKHEQIS